MSWKDLVTGTLGAISVFAFLGTLIQRVNAGVGSENEMKMVEYMKKVGLEYRDKGLTEEKRIEQAEINTLQDKFSKKWGVQDSGHVIHTLITQKPSPAP